jgi:N-acetylneuraminic acid mutarotase
MMKKRAILCMLLIHCFILSTISFPLANATEDSWATLEPMPTVRRRLGVAVVDGKIYAIGGFNGTALSTNEMYDPETDTWTTKEPMPSARYGFGITVVDGKIYVIGGCNRWNSWSCANQVYDPATDTWKKLTSIPEQTNFVGATAINDKIYVIGGLATFLPPYISYDLNQVYDTKTDSWDLETPILQQVHDYGSAIVDNKIYILGGYDIGYEPQEKDLTQIYDTENETWSYGTSLSTAIWGAAAGATSGVLAPKRIHLLKENIHYVYDPENDSWTEETPMLTPRSYVSVSVVNDEIYAIGGYDGDNYLAVNEKYTPADYIPEFPSWVLLPLFVFATLAVIVYRKKFMQ